METIEISKNEYNRLKREEELRVMDMNEALGVRRRLVRAENCIHEMLESLRDYYRYSVQIDNPHYDFPAPILVQHDKGEVLNFADVKRRLESTHEHYVQSNSTAQTRELIVKDFDEVEEQRDIFLGAMVRDPEPRIAFLAKEVQKLTEKLEAFKNE